MAYIRLTGITKDCRWSAMSLRGSLTQLEEVLKLEEVFNLDTPPQILTASTNTYS